MRGEFHIISNQETDFDIVVAGGGPAAVGYLHALVQLTADPIKFTRHYSRWVMPFNLQKLESAGLDLSFCFIKGPRPTNQFVAVWDEPFSELQPFGLKVADFVTHHSKILEWEFPSLKIRYESPYCSIDHLKVLDTLEQTFKTKITTMQCTVQDVQFKKDFVSTLLSDGSRIRSKIFVDACGQASILNDKHRLNDSSPIFQMLVWKFPEMGGYDRNVNNIWYKPAALYRNPQFSLDDHVAGWFHPVGDGTIVGASKYLFRPLSPITLTKLLEPYLKEYLRIRGLNPAGEKQVFNGIGVLYNPHHRLKLPRLLQLGDARRIARPSTGYGFIPALWHSLYGAIATGIAFKKQDFSQRALDTRTMKYFNYRFHMNYSFGYMIQQFYLNGGWKNAQNVFDILGKIQSRLPTGFFDRLTMAQFRRQDALYGLPHLIETFILRREFPLDLPPRVILDCLKHLLYIQLFTFNPLYK